jgi:hypothetical protein
VSLGTKLNDLKETLAGEFDVSSNQRLFYMGRELKSGGRSLSKLGLGKFAANVLHLHVPPPTGTLGTSNIGISSGTKRRRKEIEPSQQEQHRPSQRYATALTSSGGDVIEIIDDGDDDEIQVVSA